jgi:hypothetical protein
MNRVNSTTRLHAGCASLILMLALGFAPDAGAQSPPMGGPMPPTGGPMTPGMPPTGGPMGPGMPPTGSPMMPPQTSVFVNISGTMPSENGSAIAFTGTGNYQGTTYQVTCNGSLAGGATGASLQVGQSAKYSSNCSVQPPMPPDRSWSVTGNGIINCNPEYGVISWTVDSGTASGPSGSVQGTATRQSAGSASGPGSTVNCPVTGSVTLQ